MCLLLPPLLSLLLLFFFCLNCRSPNHRSHNPSRLHSCSDLSAICICFCLILNNSSPSLAASIAFSNVFLSLGDFNTTRASDCLLQFSRCLVQCFCDLSVKIKLVLVSLELEHLRSLEFSSLAGLPGRQLLLLLHLFLQFPKFCIDCFANGADQRCDQCRRWERPAGARFS